MKHAWILIAVLAATLAVSMPARAQEKGQVGLVMGYPASIGVQFQVSDSVALRPDVSFSTGSGSSSYTGASSEQTTDSHGYAITLGVDALFYLKKWDSLRAYVTPGFAYGHSSTTNSGSAFMYTTRSTSDVYQVTGSFGVQYAISKRFGIMGEVGVAYGDRDSDSGPVDGTGGSTSSATDFSSRAAVGVVFYLK